MTRATMTAFLAVLLAAVPGIAEPLDVVVSITPLAWLVEEIGSEHVSVAVLVGPGESAATYQPTDLQVTQLMRSRVFFRIGAPFERGLWFDAVREMGRFVMVDLREGIELHGDDPHTWLSPANLQIQAALVASALADQDPNHRTAYKQNLDRLRRRLAALDEAIRERLAPFAGRSFLVFHPSWGYFAAHYDLRQIAIEHSGREPSDREMTELRRQAGELGIRTVFVQPQIHDRSAREFARAIGASVVTLDPLAYDVEANLTAAARYMARSFTEVDVVE